MQSFLLKTQHTALSKLGLQTNPTKIACDIGICSYLKPYFQLIMYVQIDAIHPIGFRLAIFHFYFGLDILGCLDILGLNVIFERTIPVIENDFFNV